MPEKSRFEPGTEYWNPYRPPGKAPSGYKWECSYRHPEKDYPERWILAPLVSGDSEERAGGFGNLYGVDPEKMESDWERATSKKGRPPIGGAQDD